MCVFAIDYWISFEQDISYISKIRLIKDTQYVLVGDLGNRRQAEKKIAENYTSKEQYSGTSV